MQIKKRLVGIVLAASLLGGGAAIATAASAQAHDAQLSCVVSGTTGTVKLDLANYPAGSTVSGTLDGQNLGTIPFSPSYHGQTSVDLNTAHTYDVTVVSGDHNAAYNHHYTGDTATLCGVPVPQKVALVPVTFAPATCDVAASYTVPALPTGLKFTDGSLSGQPYLRANPGTYSLGTGQTAVFQEHSIAGYIPVSAVYGPFTGQDALGYQSADPSAPCFSRPDQPQPVVTRGKTVETTTCKTDDVLQETTVTTTPYVWDETTKTYIEDTAHATTTTESTTRPKTDAEEKACQPATEPTNPPTTSTPQPTPSQSSSTPSSPQPTPSAPAKTSDVVSSSPAPSASAVAATSNGGDSLAYTGSDDRLLFLLVVLLVGTGGAVLIRRAVLKRRDSQQR